MTSQAYSNQVFQALSQLSNTNAIFNDPTPRNFIWPYEQKPKVTSKTDDNQPTINNSTATENTTSSNSSLGARRLLAKKTQ